jgi:protein involved in polysaccharide export with SLBB domain
MACSSRCHQKPPRRAGKSRQQKLSRCAGKILRSVSRQPPGERCSWRLTAVNHSSTVPQYVPGSVQRPCAVRRLPAGTYIQPASDGAGCSQKGILRVPAGSDVMPCKDTNRRNSARLGRHPLRLSSTSAPRSRRSRAGRITTPTSRASSACCVLRDLKVPPAKYRLRGSRSVLGPAQAAPRPCGSASQR